MKQLLLTTILLSFTCWGQCWFHFSKNVTEGQADAVLKQYHLIPQIKLDTPLRTMTNDPCPPNIRDSEVISAGQDSSPQYTQTFYSPWGLTEKQRDKYTTTLAIGSFTFLTLWGAAAWDWGKDGLRFGTGTEGWFGQNTYSGGADKFGHMFSLYMQKRTLNWMLIQMGHERQQANLYSTLMAEGLGIALEIGDGVSKYLFSFEDLFVDTVGIVFAYFLDKYPWLDELVGLKLEWWPSKKYLDSRNPDKTDISSDYNGMKFLLSFKAAGIPLLNRNSFLRYLTFDVGYYTRGYLPDLTPDDTTDEKRTRHLMAGIGINLSELIFNTAPKKKYVRGAATIFKYWTPPHTIAPVSDSTL